jgi:hypothetical protein
MRKPAGSTSDRLPFRVRIVELPPSQFEDHEEVTPALQAGDTDTPGRLHPDGSVILEGELRVRRVGDGDPPRFLGPYAFGPPASRFVYVRWSGAHDGRRDMFRRMKIPLGGITWAQVDEVVGQPGQCLAVTVTGTARDGGPACATVPLLDGGWQVAPATPAG